MSRIAYNIALSAAAFFAIACACGCAGGSPGTAGPMVSGPLSATPVQHIVVIMQENRSFDHLFNGFPGADTVQTGMSRGVQVPLVPTPLGNGQDIDHSHTGW